MIRWSVVAGLLGVLGTWVGMGRLDGRESRRPARSPRLAESGARAVLVHFALVTLAFLALEYALVSSDFRLRYVAQNSARAYALWYKIAGLWAALEGSLVLWAWMTLLAMLPGSWLGSARTKAGSGSLA